MTLVASTIPNLVSGVSQQPAPSRLKTSGTEMINGFPSVVSGLMKRPPIEWQFTTEPVMNFGADSGVHFIDRSPTERYILVCGNGDLELYDLEGNKKTVTFPDGKAYLPATGANQKLRFVTVADTTFILNTEVVTQAQALSETRGDPYARGSVFIKRAVPSVTYAVYINGSLVGSYSTKDNTTAETALEGTAAIAQGLAADMQSRGHSGASAVGTTVTFPMAANAVVTVLDQFGGAAMTPYSHKVQDFTDLPPRELNGRLVKVEGSLNGDDGSYWVEHDGGVWTETVGYNERRQLNAATMPHILVKTGTNSFEFRRNDWLPRSVGDHKSNPDPSFVGSPINAMFLFKGRLGFLAEENMIMSAVALFEELYLTTAVQQVASDPIDVAAATGRVSTLRHAVSFSDELLLFSDRVQFRVTSGQVLSAETVGITSAAAYPCSKDTPPVVVGSTSYFLADGATHSVARELFFLPDGETLEGENISVQVPSYIPKNISVLIGSETTEFLVALSADTPQDLYIYKWYTSERRKVQSAWSKWTVGPHDLFGIGFIDQYLYLIYKDGPRMRVERMAVGPIIEQPVLLDHFVTEQNVASITYDAGSDTSTVILPSPFEETVRFFRTDNQSGTEYKPEKIDAVTYRFDGDITLESFYAGLDYEFMYRFSNQYLREETKDGESAIQDGRLQLSYFSVIYTDTSYFEAHVTPIGGDTRVTIFNGRILADPDNIVDVIPRDTGEFKFPVFAQNEQVQIELKNDQPFRCAFGSVEWSGHYKPKAKRVK